MFPEIVTKEKRKTRLAGDINDISAPHADLVFDVTNTDCPTQNDADSLYRCVSSTQCVCVCVCVCVCLQYSRVRSQTQLSSSVCIGGMTLSGWTVFSWGEMENVFALLFSLARKGSAAFFSFLFSSFLR